jgi:glyceraldehyde-3-phosphate dehydrogenase/erythrose-4-phosphate dehydrogenase
MAVRVGINGFGRTGRAAFRAAYESGADIHWVAINDVADPATLFRLLSTTRCTDASARAWSPATGRFSWTGEGS